MLKRLTALSAALVLFGASAPAHAQSDILLRLRSGSPLGDRFRVDSAGRAQVRLSNLAPPATGPYRRFAVTLEPTPTGAGPTGPTHLLGTLDTADPA